MRAGVSAGVARYAATSLVVAAALSADTLSRGHDHYFNLEYDEAIAAYEQAHREEPENPNIPNHLATAILFKELHRLGKLETSAFKGDNDFLLQDKPKPDLEVKRRFEEALAKGRRIAESRLKPNESDRLGLFALAQNYGLEANYEFIDRQVVLCRPPRWQSSAKIQRSTDQGSPGVCRWIPGCRGSGVRGRELALGGQGVDHAWRDSRRQGEGPTDGRTGCGRGQSGLSATKRGSCWLCSIGVRDGRSMRRS